jgi:hypothetical protein
MKLEEIEAFRAEEERLLTPELGPEKAREQAQIAAEARLTNLEEEIREQLRADIAQAREKRLGIPKRYRRDSADGEDGLAGVCQSTSCIISVSYFVSFSATTSTKTRSRSI